MLYKSEFPLEAVRSLPEDDAHRALEGLESIRLENARQAKNYHNRVRSLGDEYLRDRNSIIGAQNRERLLELRRSQSDRFRSEIIGFEEQPEAVERLFSERAKIEAESRAAIGNLGVDEVALDALRDSYWQRAESAFIETLGRGDDAGSAATPVPEDDDPEFFPPDYLWPWTEIEIEGRPQVQDWDNYRTGTIGGSILCTLLDEGDNVAKGATIRQSWIMGYRTTQAGRLVATIDLHPNTFFSSVHIRDEFGSSAVSINRSFRVFSQSVLPGANRRYWHENGTDQIVSRGLGVSTWGGASNRLPHGYFEKGRLHSYDASGDIEDPEHENHFTGTPVGGRTWSYDLLGDSVGANRAGIIVVGIEIRNRVWGDDCTVHNLINYEFVTPKISWYVV